MATGACELGSTFDALVRVRAGCRRLCFRVPAGSREQKRALSLAQLEKEIELQTAKNEALSLNPAAKVEENYPQNLERENKNCYICGDSSHYARDCEKRFKPKESNGHIHNRKNANTLKVESEKQNDEFPQLQYVNIFVENQP
ncbi:hypothetical protein TNCV_3116451 [Trichonephila clavipes]|nr:hypothetical protein TNCV_3116451 [Trichonephila clavipes]